MTNKIIFGLSLALLVVVVLYWKSCHKSTLILPTKSDSVVAENVKKAADDTVINKKFVDSTNAVILSLTHWKDSTMKLLGLVKGQLKGKDVDIQQLIGVINSAESNKDTAGAIAACDSLKAAYPIAKGLVTQYIRSNDSLIKVNDFILKNKDTIIGRLNSAYNEANSMLFETSRQYGLVSDNYKKALKQANKKWSIGPTAGYGIAGNGLGPFIGVSINYSLFKF